MTEADQRHTFSALNQETWLTYRALSGDEALSGDALAIIGGSLTQDIAAATLERWIVEEDNPLSDGVGLYAQLLALALERVDWKAVVSAFTPEDPRDVEDLLAREAYAAPATGTAARVPDSVSHSLPVGE
jgi:hypothetical protein